MKRFFMCLMCLVGLSLAAGFTGCVSTKLAEADSDQVSTIPWNRPASWEGRGPLGGVMMMDGQR